MRPKIQKIQNKYHGTTQEDSNRTDKISTEGVQHCFTQEWNTLAIAIYQSPHNPIFNF